MRPIWLATAATLAAVVGIATWQLWPSQPAAAPASTTKATFDLNGSLTLHSTQIDYWSGKAGEPCTTKGGFRDLAEGAPVTVYDASGTAVAIGTLAAGQWFSGCMWTFNIPDVPESPVIQVEVSHRGKVPFSLDGAKAGKVDLTIQG